MATHFTVSCTFEHDDSASFGFLVVFENDNGDFIHDDLDRGTWRIINWGVVQSHARVSGDLDDDR